MHVRQWNNHARIQKSMHGTGTKTRARQKHYDRLLVIIYKHLNCFTYGDTAPHHSHKRKEKATLKRRERQTGSVDLYGVEP